MIEMDKEPDEVILRPSPAKWGCICVACAAAAVCGVFMIVSRAEGGRFVFLFSVLGAFVAGALLVPGVAYLKLTQEGFEFRAPMRRRYYRWSDVTEFVAYGPISYPMVCCNLVDPSKTKWYHRLLRPWNPYRIWLPDTYGMEAVQLAAMLNEFRAPCVE